MKMRSLFAFTTAAASVVIVSGTGCKATGVGDPCTPEQEYNDTFLGFDIQQVNVESKSFQCQTRLCLVNHFQGRASCPYGQDSTGNAPAGAKAACSVPGTQTPVKGEPGNPSGAAVSPQCTNRTTDKAVYCSCRCANIDGKTGDGAKYCACPDGFSCQQLVTSIGAVDTGLTGAYCVKDGTQYDPNVRCKSECNPQDPTAKCD